MFSDIRNQLMEESAEKRRNIEDAISSVCGQQTKITSDVQQVQVTIRGEMKKLHGHVARLESFLVEQVIQSAEKSKCSLQQRLCELYQCLGMMDEISRMSDESSQTHDNLHHLLQRIHNLSVSEEYIEDEIRYESNLQPVLESLNMFRHANEASTPGHSPSYDPIGEIAMKLKMEARCNRDDEKLLQILTPTSCAATTLYFKTVLNSPSSLWLNTKDDHDKMSKQHDDKFPYFERVLRERNGKWLVHSDAALVVESTDVGKRCDVDITSSSTPAFPYFEQVLNTDNDLWIEPADTGDNISIFNSRMWLPDLGESFSMQENATFPYFAAILNQPDSNWIPASCSQQHQSEDGDDGLDEFDLVSDASSASMLTFTSQYQQDDTPYGLCLPQTTPCDHMESVAFPYFGQVWSTSNSDWLM